MICKGSLITLNLAREIIYLVHSLLINHEQVQGCWISICAHDPKYAPRTQRQGFGHGVQLHIVACQSYGSFWVPVKMRPLKN